VPAGVIAVADFSPPPPNVDEVSAPVLDGPPAGENQCTEGLTCTS
jgi:hypothetical protein